MCTGIILGIHRRVLAEYAFEVQKDQAKAGENGNLGGYEASDFLWGKAEEVAPSTKVIRLAFRHKMSTARVTLVEGEGLPKVNGRGWRNRCW